MKISETMDNIKAFTEFACMVCMAEKRTGNIKYNGCAMRKMGEYCPWMCEVIKKHMEDKDKNKEDIFSNWAKIPVVQELFKPKEEEIPRYTNLKNLK